MDTKLDTPDVTTIQKLVAAVGGLITAVVLMVNAFEWYDISGEQALAVGGAWASFGSVLVIADAVIRSGRAKGAGLAAQPNLPVNALSQPVYGELLSPVEVGTVELESPGYGGERVVVREDVPSGAEREGTEPGA